MFFNLLAALLTIFSFAVVIPILEMLFQIKETGFEYMHLGEASLKDVVINNFYFWTQEAIAAWGPSFTLGALGMIHRFTSRTPQLSH